ncbi:MAG: S9 family peptidase [Anaerolineales bacterium]
MAKIIAPYGSWKSPITTELITALTKPVVETQVEGKEIYWSEMRPLEAGRYVIRHRFPDGRVEECTPAGFNARTRVHEYGGGAFTVAEGVIYFVNFADQRLYRQRPGEAPQVMTPQEGYRYADLVVDRQRRTIFCVREDHSGEGEAVNTLVRLPLEGGENGRVIASGNDFYASPRLSPDGRWLAFLTWNHPNMPWDGTELWVGELDKFGELENLRKVAGGPQESIFQPEWSPDGRLYFVSDRSNWWNLYRWDGDRIEALYPMEAEFGKPQWVFGMSTYGFWDAGRMLCTYTQNGFWYLAWLDVEERRLTPIDLPYTFYNGIRIGEGFALFEAASPTRPSGLIRFEPLTGQAETLHLAFEPKVAERYISIPQSITFPSLKGEAYGFFYPPQNAEYEAPAGERPPLIVISHGGPTSATQAVLNYSVQFWTSRGVAVLDVNYGGSTGYGREYRMRLNGNWGVVDVEDCCNGALFLAKQGLVDRERMAIRGGSAGGYTTLACLTFRPEVFRAGTSLFGLSDLTVFVHDTHKFESRYLTTLVGPYPERADLYRERSPIYHVDRLSCPLLLLQGDEDRIVPPNQSELIYQAALAKGLPVAYLLFRGEQHGFRKAESIRRALEAELYFYGRVFGFEPADAIEAVEIANL